MDRGDIGKITGLPHQQDRRTVAWISTEVPAEWTGVVARLVTINLAILVSETFQVLIIELPFFERLFRFEAISFFEFFILALLASLILWVGEVYKHIRYRKKNLSYSRS